MTGLRRGWIILGCLLLAGALGVAGYLRVQPWHAFSQELAAIEESLNSIEHETPEGVNDADWHNLWTCVFNGVSNAIYSPSVATPEAIVHFRRDLDEKLHQDSPASVEMMEWIWKRTAAVGPTPARTLRQLQPHFDHAVRECDDGGLLPRS